MNALLSDLERSVLQRLSNSYDECGEPGWLDLSEVLLFLDQGVLDASEDQMEISPGSVVDQVVNVLERAYADELIEKFEENSFMETRFRITDHGSYVLSGAGPLVSEQSDTPQVPTFDSSAWTGIEQRMTKERREQLHAHLETLRACIRQSDLDDRTKENVGKRLDAVRGLIDAPDPPWRAIVELLNHPALTAFLNFSAILTILFGNM